MLRDHLVSVAQRAAEYAKAFGAHHEARLAGLLHDIGKYGDLFQKRLQGKEKGIDHWSLGAFITLQRYEAKGVAAAFCVQGHHIGLQEFDLLRSLNPSKFSGDNFHGLKLSDRDPKNLLARLHLDGLSLPEPEQLRDSFSQWPNSYSATFMLDVRMLFSALVDADFIETEAHFQGGLDGNKLYRKPGPVLDPQAALGALLPHVERIAGSSICSADVRKARAVLLQSCLEAAEASTGLFTLTAPTGSGKTLSLLSFALRHAAKHGLRRVITVIPYLSIIEQTAAEYRRVFFDQAQNDASCDYVLEDHSLAGTRVESSKKNAWTDDAEDDEAKQNSLLAENWDAPIVVTTTVQLLESLFSNRPSACRKLHRLARSVILFDEVQTLPVELAIPTLATLSHLASHYGSTVVFSTATQPAFSHLEPEVLKYCSSGWQPREIVPDNQGLFSILRRTKIHWPSDSNQRESWDELAYKISGFERILCIVNLKKHALRLHEKVSQLVENNLFHLSTNMCSEHRRKVLRCVRRLLSQGRPCRLISTQCVEAGVDIDFPVVFRAWGPLDAIAQASGRCNRHGLLKEGSVYVFIPEEEGYPDGAYEQAASVGRIALSPTIWRKELYIDDPALVSRYYRELYTVVKTEKKQLLEAIKRYDFPSVALSYQLIPKDSINVLVPYDLDVFQKLKTDVQERGLTRDWILRARDFSVSLYRPPLDSEVNKFLDPVPLGRGKSGDWFIYLKNEHYSPDRGLVPTSPEDWFIA